MDEKALVHLSFHLTEAPYLYISSAYTYLEDPFRANTDELAILRQLLNKLDSLSVDRKACVDLVKLVNRDENDSAFAQSLDTRSNFISLQRPRKTLFGPS